MSLKILLSGENKIENYIDAINHCGGCACLEYDNNPANQYDGLVLCGGCDVHPRYYAEEINGAVNINEKLDVKEFELARAFISAKKPILAICRGSQLINILFGGSLHQNLANAELHQRTGNFDSVHQVNANGWISDLYGKQFTVNSAHHQGVKKLGDGLIVNAMADNIVEAFSHERLPIIAVQFHPERMCFLHARTDTVDGSKIFEYFWELCKNNAAL